MKFFLLTTSKNSLLCFVISNNFSIFDTSKFHIFRPVFRGGSQGGHSIFTGVKHCFSAQRFKVTRASLSAKTITKQAKEAVSL